MTPQSPAAPTRPLDIDTVYTHLCTTMTALGEDNASSFLARFALLAIGRLDDGEAAIELIDAAAAGISTTCAAADRPCG